MFSNLSVVNKDAGSLKYLAPEILERRANAVTPALDIWSLGCILFGMVAGELPFAGKHAEDIMGSICSGKWELPANIVKKLSYEIKDLIGACLNLDPKKRITINEMYDHPWLQNKPITMYLND